MSFTLPADVPLHARTTYRKNYRLLTRGTGNLFLFAADHKIEHLDADFHGQAVAPEAHDPHHLFSIAQAGHTGALATQLGLIARYGPQYPDVTYLAKLNSTTNIIPRSEKDPFSQVLWSVDDVLALDFTIPGIGVTVYLGSTDEAQMLNQAAQAIFKAHQRGLIAVIWLYPRGKAVADEQDPALLAGAVGVANALGADFVKIHAPADSAQLGPIVQAAGNTRVITAGGLYKDQASILNEIRAYMTISGTAGAAIGRSIFQHSLTDAIELTKELAALMYGKKKP